MRTTVKKVAQPLLLGLMLGSGGCADLTVPDYNNPGLDELEGQPTRAMMIAAASGLLIDARGGITARTGYVNALGILGRESVTLDGSDPRFVTEYLVGPLTNSGAYGGGNWAAPYATIRDANTILNSLDRVQPALTNAEKEGIRGFAKTIQALEFLRVINTRDVNGAPIEVNQDPRAAPAPLVNRAGVFAHILKLLDEGRTHLQAAGSSFAFPLSPGFSQFATPATFVRFNWALRARVESYLGSLTTGAERTAHYRAALDALSRSFLDPSGSLTLGAYHTYGSGSGDALNGLNATVIFAHPSVTRDAEKRPDGSADLRLAKVRTVASRTQLGVTSNLRFTLYTSTTPVPVIRNEELILLRAEAKWFTQDGDDAVKDINLIRQRAGGLAPISLPASDADFVTELLKQRRYSLMFEGGHRWIDHRRFGRLNQLPKDQPNHVIVSAFQIPDTECQPRGSSTCSAAS
ncbi:MAG TPA: RagB/SusD family nutrient uptake outer membrane protein [Longimicrobiaceae bacterium]|nr:RagB/SusD family nutrient uptake outer membrane protein [Longimicrobiaceae bacterium]